MEREREREREGVEEKRGDKMEERFMGERGE